MIRWISGAVAALRQKFSSAKAYGPQQVAVFYDSASSEEQEMKARRAYELVTRFLDLIDVSGTREK